MRIATFSLLFILVLVSCKKETAVESQDNTTSSTSFKGEYLHYGDAAVFITQGDYYAVQLDEKVEELDTQAQQIKKTPFDMVTVVLTGALAPNTFKEKNGNGWDQMLVIDEIIEVRASRENKMPSITQEEN